jgi:hypothetical protein
MTFENRTFQLDDMLVAPPRFIIGRVRGTAAIPGLRDTDQHVAFRHGVWDDDDPYVDGRTLALRIEVHSVDEYGERTESAYWHLRDNWEDLAAVAGKRGLIDVRQYIPSVESGESIELQGFARRRSQVELDGDAAVWVLDLELKFAYPWWHELPLVELASDTSHAIDTGGSAPIADMVFTFAGDGTLTDDLNLGHEIGIAGSSGLVTVDVGKREVYEGGELAMGLLRLGDGSPENWMEWPARTTINLTADVAVAVDYYVARH